MLTKVLGKVTAASPALKRNMWRGWYQFLASRYPLDDWTFMNYGFEPAEGDPRPGPALDAADEPDRCPIQLYHRVAGGAPTLRGTDVLEVGSGRGGGSSFMARYLGPKSVLGVDYSDTAVELSLSRHAAVPGLSFKQGDAEALPCADGSFDAVVNVESSHCYGSVERFFGEAFRVLRPGGHFLWADMRGRNGIRETKGQLEAAGFTVVEEEEITPGVVRGLDRAGARKREMIGRNVPKFLLPHFSDFAGVPGTRVYESLKGGDVEYWRLACRRPE
jgi:SAM-dependent methyltransferase